ncbi:hypothetical protein NUW54_g7931 [Trametes sanguinea]|uniref:Uncharacterized protein n=1 Tax=Trametes sanguinea TaxID=158606 RepID=A0ACC1PIH1_9APHY|nr:hypothetical protein NUW54_g7931 [Trametes sanguinea]
MLSLSALWSWVLSWEPAALTAKGSCTALTATVKPEVDSAAVASIHMVNLLTDKRTRFIQLQAIAVNNDFLCKLALPTMSPSQGAYNVPMALDLQLCRTDGLHPEHATARLWRHIAEGKKSTIGPMPVNSFLEELLPLPPSATRHRLSSTAAFNGVPHCADNDAEIYMPLLQALNKRTKTKSRCPGFEFVDTYKRSRRPTHPGYAKPHICCFTPVNAGIVRDASPRSRVEFAYAELFVQVASDPATDIFIDPIDTGTTHDFLRNIEDEESLEEAEQTYGLHAAYATEIFARQHRLFLFSVSLHGSFARFFRWDRAGCLVSEVFDIRQQPELFTDFLWRFSQLPDAKRGLDTTIPPASSDQEALFRDAIREHVRLQLELEGDELEKAVSAHYLPGHVTVLPVTSRHSSTSEATVHRFIVSRPVVSPLSLTGRGTRGFWAVQATTGRVVFLKDCWRFYPTVELEGDVLRRLNDLGVRNVPILTAHGDVPMDPCEGRNTEPVFQSSLTEEFAKDSWVCTVNGKRIRVNEVWHYRLVTSTVGYGLQTLRGTEELLHATHDALIAMKDAYTKDSRIHRDLSVGNIILIKEPDHAVRKGYLIDWETSDRVDDAGEALHSGRAGTWLFMSIRMLHHLQAYGKHTLADDLEALLYVVLYCALLYLSHNLSIEEAWWHHAWRHCEARQR